MDVASGCSTSRITVHNYVEKQKTNVYVPVCTWKCNSANILVWSAEGGPRRRAPGNTMKLLIQLSEIRLDNVAVIDDGFWLYRVKTS